MKSRVVIAVLAVGLSACGDEQGNRISAPSALATTASASTDAPAPSQPPAVTPPIAADGPTPSRVLCAQKASVSTVFLRDERVRFRNVSDTCTAKVWLVSFFAPKPLPDTSGQAPEDSVERDLAPGEEVVLTVRLPRYEACGVTWWYQVDAVFNGTQAEARRSPHKGESLIDYVFQEVKNAACFTPPPPPETPPQSPPPATCNWTLHPDRCKQDGTPRDQQ